MDETPPAYLTNSQIVRDMYDHRERIREQMGSHEREWQHFRDEMRDRAAAHEKSVNQRFWWERGGGVAVVFVAIIGFVVTVSQLRSEVRATVQARLDKEFGSPQIHQTIEDSAVKAAEVVATEKLRPQVEEAKALVATTASEVAILKERNRIASLGNAAITEGSVASFTELDRLSKTAGDPISKAAEAEVARVKIAYLFASRLGGFELKITTADGKVLTNEAIPTSDLLNVLSDFNRDWKERAKAAEILRDTRRMKRGVPDALLSSACGDPHLEVVRNALQGFERVTGFDGVDILECVHAKRWWVEKKESLADQFKEEPE